MPNNVSYRLLPHERGVSLGSVSATLLFPISLNDDEFIYMLMMHNLLIHEYQQMRLHLLEVYITSCYSSVIMNDTSIPF